VIRDVWIALDVHKQLVEQVGLDEEL
jgi:hypothetical protein